MTITLRQETAAGTTTKGSSLTYAELDNNFVHLLRQGSVTVRGDSGTDQTLGEADKDSILQIAGGTNITTTVSSDSAGETVLTIDGTDLNTTYSTSVVADGSNANLRLTGSDASTDDVQLVAGTNVTLSVDSAGALTIDATGTGIGDVVDDTTPQLGGDLDVNGNKIVSQTDVAITIEPAGNGQILLEKQTQINELKNYTETVYAGGTVTGAITINAANGPVQDWTLTGNVTFAGFQTAEDGQSVTLIIRQDGTGSRTFSENLDSANRMLFAGGEQTLSTAANAIDIMTILYADGIYYASLSTNYS